MGMNQKLKAWWSLCIPRADIMREFIPEREFTADFGAFLSGEVTEIYRDAVKFFDNTYITQEMHKHFKNILTTVSGRKTTPSIIQIDIPYGGGKTHTLIALYHLIKSIQTLKTHPKLESLYSSFSVPEDVKIACFDGVSVGVDGVHHVDTGIKTRTFIGEILYQLGVYGMVKEEDLSGKSIGAKKIGDCLKKVGPCLILIDEFLVYVAKIYPQFNNPELKPIIDTLLTSIQELYTAVANYSDASALVITYPSRVQQILNEYAKDYKDKLSVWISSYKDVTQRTQTTKMLAADTLEVGSILQTRLFEDLPALAIREEVAKAFNSYYHDPHIQKFLPQVIQQKSYDKELVSTYPFHPELLRIFYEQWGTIPNFQLTRHLLKILVEVIREEFNKSEENRRISPIIMPSHINLVNPNIQATLFNAIDRNYREVLSSDIDRATNIDKRFDPSTPLGKGRFTEGITTAIFLHSHSGSTADTSPRAHVASKGATISSCLLAVLTPYYKVPFPDPNAGLPPIEEISNITEKLLDSEIGLYYLHCTTDFQYYFDLKKNLTMIAAEYYSNSIIDSNELILSIQKAWESRGVSLKPIFFPSKPKEIPDSSIDLMLVFIDPRQYVYSSSNQKIIEEYFLIAARAPPGVSTGELKRLFKNRLFFITADENLWRDVEENYRWNVAWKTTIKLKSFENASSPEQSHARRQVEKYENEYQKGLRTLFHHLYIIKTDPKGPQFEHIDLRQYLLVKDVSLLARVDEFLLGRIDKNTYYIWDRLRPDLLVNTERYTAAWAPEQAIISAQQLWENFAQYTSLPKLMNQNTLQICIQEGLQKSLFGVAYKKSGEAYYSHILSEGEELDTDKPFNEIFLYRIDSYLEVKCKDCGKIFSVNSTGADFLCSDCIRVTCARCSNIVRASEIINEIDGCIICKEKEKCPNCSQFVVKDDLRMNGNKCVLCLNKIECPACHTWVLEDLLRPQPPEDPKYCINCESWLSCSQCHIRFPLIELEEGVCRKCRITSQPPPPIKIHCQKCKKLFFPSKLEDGLCPNCRKTKKSYVSQVKLRIPLSNLNEEASVLSDIQTVFMTKRVDDLSSGEITLTIQIPPTRATWMTEEEVRDWISTNFETNIRKVKSEVKTSYHNIPDDKATD